jgi:hypothetical protein
MPPTHTPSPFDLVRQLALSLPDVVESTLHGAPSWKLHGKLLACPALHKSAEPDSLMVKVPPAERAQRLAADPAVCYLTDHYQNQPVILVRLPLIDRKTLQALLTQAWQFLNAPRAPDS